MAFEKEEIVRSRDVFLYENKNITNLEKSESARRTVEVVLDLIPISLSPHGAT